MRRIKEMRVVTGGRHYGDALHVNRVMDAERPDFVLTGGATGADQLVERWCRRHSVPYLSIPVGSEGGHGWSILGKRAGPQRNLELMEWAMRLHLMFGEVQFFLPNLKGIAFPGNDGTNGMVEIMTTAGIEIRDERHYGQ